MIRASIIGCCLLAVVALFSNAQEKTRPRPMKEAAPAITPEREAAVNTFVSLHHSELESLLKKLKSSNPKQYDRAVRELFLTSERLAQLRESEPQRYELELQAWQVRSRVQLLTAKLTMSSDAELKKLLKAALQEQYDTKHRLLAYDRDKLREKMKKIEQDMNDHQSKREAAIEKQYEQLTSLATPGKGKSEDGMKNENKSKVEKRSEVNIASPAPPQ